MNEEQFAQIIATLRLRIPSLGDPVFSEDEEVFRAQFGGIRIDATKNGKSFIVGFCNNNAKLPAVICVPNANDYINYIDVFINYAKSREYKTETGEFEAVAKRIREFCFLEWPKFGVCEDGKTTYAKFGKFILQKQDRLDFYTLGYHNCAPCHSKNESATKIAFKSVEESRNEIIDFVLFAKMEGMEHPWIM